MFYNVIYKVERPLNKFVGCEGIIYVASTIIREGRLYGLGYFLAMIISWLHNNTDLIGHELDLNSDISRKLFKVWAKDKVGVADVFHLGLRAN